MSGDASSYLPGDIVSVTLPGGGAHIMIVADPFSADWQRRLILHNIGGGAQEEDLLFAFDQTGHFRLTDQIIAKIKG
jgi:uncharacterized protein YijF (DUF1287 family)